MRHTQRIVSDENWLEKSLFVLRIQKWMKKNYWYIYYETFFMLDVWKKGTKTIFIERRWKKCGRYRSIISSSGVSSKFSNNSNDTDSDMLMKTKHIQCTKRTLTSYQTLELQFQLWFIVSIEPKSEPLCIRKIRIDFGPTNLSKSIYVCVVWASHWLFLLIVQHH